MTRAWPLLVLLAGLSGCFRLTDPFYAFRHIEAGEPEGPENSLLFGTIEIEGGLFSPTDVDEVSFERVVPERRYPYASQNVLFRAFQPRAVERGHFVVELPPGVYELHEVRGSGGLGRPTRWVASEALKRQSRFFVTRPGIFDLGTLKLRSEGLFDPYRLSRVDDVRAERLEVLVRAVRGTGWERLIPAGK